MAKRRNGSSLLKFQARFGSEQACIEHLAKVKWPLGYRCRKCGHEKAYQLTGQPRVFMCARCNHQESVTAGTLLHRTKLPLMKWFWAVYLFAQDKRGVSATHLSRELDLRYDTAWHLLHKLRRALAGQKEAPLGGVVEVDETYLGGKGSSNSRGRSLANENKSLVIMAVERKLARGKKMPGLRRTGFLAGNAKVAMIASAGAKDLTPFLKANLAQGTNLLSDGWAGYKGLEQNFKHEAIIQGKPSNAALSLPLVHLQFSNLKSWLNGTFHGVSPKHLPAYLIEWNYRFNRRGVIADLFWHVIKRVVNSMTVTYRQIAEGLKPFSPLHGANG